MNTDFATALDECLDRLKAGDTIAACLERYPEHAAELQPLLETVPIVEALRFTEPPHPQALARGRQRFLTQAVRLREAQQDATVRSLVARVRGLFGAGVPSPVWGRAATAIVLMLLLFATISGVAVQASESSLPGDPLYPVKQMTRQVQLLTTFNAQAREAKERQIEAREREEVRQATEQGRVFEQEVAGVIVDWQGSAFVLENNLPIRLTASTVIEGQPRAGLIAEVHVRSENGRLIAERVTVRQETPAGWVFAPTETATLHLTATVEPTATARPTNTPVPTKPPPKKVVPTKTLTATPTVTETPFPTATAVVGPSIHIFELRGAIDSISPSVWVVAGQEIQIAPDTIIKGEPVVGRTAHVRANRMEDGTFIAVEINVEPPPPPEKVFITGVVQARESDAVWIIGGRRVRTDDRTKIEGDLAVNAFVEVQGLQESPNTVFAQRITVIRACENQVLFEGVIRSIDPGAGIWMVEVIVNIDGQDVPVQYTVRVNENTQIISTPVVGAVGQFETCPIGENVYSAQRINVLPTPTPVPTNTPIPTSTPEPPTLQSTPTVGPEETATPSPEPTETETLTVEPPSTVTSTSTVEPPPTVTSTSTVEPSSTVTNTPTVEPSPVPTRTPTAEPSPAMTTTPTVEPAAATISIPTVVPTPTSTNTPVPDDDLTLTPTL